MVNGCLRIAVAFLLACPISCPSESPAAAFVPITTTPAVFEAEALTLPLASRFLGRTLLSLALNPQAYIHVFHILQSLLDDPPVETMPLLSILLAPKSPPVRKWVSPPYEQAIYQLWNALPEVLSGDELIEKTRKAFEPYPDVEVGVRFVNYDDAIHAPHYVDINAPPAGLSSRIFNEIIDQIPAARKKIPDRSFIFDDRIRDTTVRALQSMFFVIENVFQHVIPERGEALILILRDTHTGRFTLYVVDSGPGMPLQQVLAGAHRGPHTGRGEAIQNLKRRILKGIPWILVSRERPRESKTFLHGPTLWDSLLNSYQLPPHSVPDHGVLFAVRGLHPLKSGMRRAA